MRGSCLRVMPWLLARQDDRGLTGETHLRIHTTIAALLRLPPMGEPRLVLGRTLLQARVESVPLHLLARVTDRLTAYPSKEVACYLSSFCDSPSDTGNCSKPLLLAPPDSAALLGWGSSSLAKGMSNDLHAGVTGSLSCSQPSHKVRLVEGVGDADVAQPQLRLQPRDALRLGGQRSASGPLRGKQQ